MQKEADEKARQKVQDELNAANERASVAETKVEEREAPARQRTVCAPTPPKDTNAKEAQRQINQSIVTALAETCMLSVPSAKAVVTAIIKGEIPNIKINY